MKRLKPRSFLPGPLECARASWANGWYSGIAVGLISGVALAVAVAQVVR